MSIYPPIRAAFMGSDELSCAYLKALAECPDIELACVVTQPDRGKGRHLRVEPGVVKKLAMQYGLPVFTPVRVNSPEVLETLAGLGLDVIVVMAYGQFLGDTLLSLPYYGCINLHVSLLPRWRGAAPIQRAILAGDTETGVTAMQMNRGMDTGDILGSIPWKIAANATTGSLGAELSPLGCSLMLDTLRALRDGHATHTPQDHSKHTLASKIQNEEAMLDWNLSAVDLDRKVRAFNPKPGAATYIPPFENRPGIRLKILASEVVELPSKIASVLPGMLLVMDQKKGPLVSCGGSTALRLLEVHPEGGKRSMPGAAFANGYRNKLPIGTMFGLR